MDISLAAKCEAHPSAHKSDETDCSKSFKQQINQTESSEILRAEKAEKAIETATGSIAVGSGRRLQETTSTEVQPLVRQAPQLGKGKMGKTGKPHRLDSLKPLRALLTRHQVAREAGP